MPAHKKDATVRARANKATSRADLGLARPARRPRLPQYVPGGEKVKWHPQARAWWAAVWDSPVVRAMIDVDARALLRLAVLEHEFWAAPTTSMRLQVSSEIRIAQQAFGLEPYARRRLEWQVRVTEDIAEPAERPGTASRGTPARRERRPDPRATLHVV